MQLVRSILIGLFLTFTINVFAQNEPSLSEKEESDQLWLKKTALTNVEVNILGSYYSQDGNHSAVTGGLGTEELTDITPAVVVIIPVDSTKQWSFSGGADFISSASTDNIDFNVSSDSRNDLRYHLDVSYTKRLARQRLTYSLSGGF